MSSRKLATNKKLIFSFTSMLFVGITIPLLAKQAKVSVISPHRKSLQVEYVAAFKKYYKEKFGSEIMVEWIDQGGTENDLRFIETKFAKNSRSAGIDIFWGGGDIAFDDLKSKGLLDPYPLSAEIAKQVPAQAAGVPLHADDGGWHATALSSFGLFYNKKLLKMRRLAEPKTWSDLARPDMQNNVSMTDPRRSASALIMNLIMLEGLGWNHGWRLLTEIAGNVKKFTHSSSDPIKAVVTGDALCATAIDFYAAAKVAKLGPEGVGFALPKEMTVFNADPVAILKGAPNRTESERFVDFLLSKNAQKLLILAEGQSGGPERNTLGRMAVNPLAYQEVGGRSISPNPFELSPTKMPFDRDRVIAIKSVVADLIGAIHVDNHHGLKKAWAALQGVAASKRESRIARLTTPPVSLEEVIKLSKDWDNQLIRNQYLNKWQKEAKTVYEQILTKT